MGRVRLLERWTQFGGPAPEVVLTDDLNDPLTDDFGNFLIVG